MNKNVHPGGNVMPINQEYGKIRRFICNIHWNTSYFKAILPVMKTTPEGILHHGQ